MWESGIKTLFFLPFYLFPPNPHSLNPKVFLSASLIVKRVVGEGRSSPFLFVTSYLRAPEVQHTHPYGFPLVPNSSSRAAGKAVVPEATSIEMRQVPTVKGYHLQFIKRNNIGNCYTKCFFLELSFQNENCMGSNLLETSEKIRI